MDDEEDFKFSFKYSGCCKDSLCVGVEQVGLTREAVQSKKY